jgi:uncharacterized membrane-anchored protein
VVLVSVVGTQITLLTDKLKAASILAQQSLQPLWPRLSPSGMASSRRLQFTPLSPSGASCSTGAAILFTFALGTAAGDLAIRSHWPLIRVTTVDGYTARHHQRPAEVNSMDQNYKHSIYTERASKVPEVTSAFWIIKILATTLGETGGDAVTMSMNLGYLAGTVIFAAIFAAAVVAQVSAKRSHPFLYWTVIVATTTVGTSFADFVDRSLGIGYLGGSSLLAALLVASLAIWHRTTGTKPAETFYWITIMFSQTLGTALGDWRPTRPGSAMPAARWSWPPGSRSLPRPISRPKSRGLSCSGSPSFSPGRWGPPLATSSTSRSTMAGWRSADTRRRPRWRPSWFC